MTVAPQGLAQLQRWCHTLDQYPLVAIGGVSEKNIAAVWQTGVSGVAMISAITQAQDPVQATLYLKSLLT